MQEFSRRLSLQNRCLSNYLFPFFLLYHLSTSSIFPFSFHYSLLRLLYTLTCSHPLKVERYERQCFIDYMIRGPCCGDSMCSSSSSTSGSITTSFLPLFANVSQVFLLRASFRTCTKPLDSAKPDPNALLSMAQVIHRQQISACRREKTCYEANVYMYERITPSP